MLRKEKYVNGKTDYFKTTKLFLANMKYLEEIAAQRNQFSDQQC